MKILGIETSCDETALAVVEAEGSFDNPKFKILAEAINSQTKIHEKYGGVYPMMAKREHSKNLVPLLKKLLSQLKDHPLVPSYDKKGRNNPLPITLGGERKRGLEIILEREPELLTQFLEEMPKIAPPDIDAIAVTVGPGLEPALWVGINFAKALAEVWKMPIHAINHMEGHIVAALMLPQVEMKFPALALLISGGHTELVLIKKWQDYKILGQTRDDAVGEAFDKVARMMELPYPGGPEISRLAELARAQKLESNVFQFPRPMINSGNYDFSFAGLKTAVLYTIRKMSEEEKRAPDWKPAIAKEFENAVTEVLISKTKKAIEEFDIKTLIIGGGVASNQHLRQSFEELIKDFPASQLLIPDPSLTTDNAVMIAMAGYFNHFSEAESSINLKAVGNLNLEPLI